MARIAVVGMRGVPASWGGIERKCEQIFPRLASMGHEVTIYARSNYVAEGITQYRGLKIVRLPTIPTKHADAIVHTWLALLHVLWTNPDIVHIYAQGPCLLSWLPRLFRPRMMVFYSCAALDWKRRKWSPAASRIIRLGEYFSVLFPHYRIVVSREIERYYRNRYGVKTYYVPNGIAAAIRKKPDLIRRFGLSERNYFLSVGRLVPEKRVEDIIAAYRRNVRGEKLVLVGDASDDGGYIKGLRRMTAGRTDVLLVGYQFGAALEEFYSNARAFITASELEGLPNSLLEAVAYGLPCIASDIQPHQEILGRTADYLYPLADTAALAARMSRISALNDRDWEAASNATRNAAQRGVSWDEVARMHHRLYLNSLNPLVHPLPPALTVSLATEPTDEPPLPAPAEER